MARVPIITVDEEISQSRSRLAICTVSLLGFFIIARNPEVRPQTLIQGFATILGYLAFAVAWHLFVTRLPRRLPPRRYVAMTADLGIMVFWMHLGEKYVTSYYPIFLWVIIGNGIRFGPRFLTVGLVLGALGFGSLLAFDDFWTGNQSLGLGLLLGVVVLPVFFLTVLRRLQVVSRLEIELAKSRLADHAKDQFLAAMSHELRTPMNGVLGMAELLKDTKLDHEQREQVHVIARSVHSLLNVINDILDYSKITTNRLTLESRPFDLKQVLTDVYLLLGPTAEDKGVRLGFDYDEGAHRDFRGDPARVRQIAFNLVGNAIKFTNQGQVTLACSVDVRRDHAQITIEVSDTGIGIPGERLAAIFDVFEQADNSVSRRYSGSGLGLSISRQLTDLMNGEISARSTVGKGSTFAVQLKLPTCELEKPRLRAPGAEWPQYGLHALVVEDNLFNQVVTRKMLARLGITCDVAENGIAALEMVDRTAYDLIFMDIRMPVMDGYETTSRLRDRKDAVAALPIIALTAENSARARERCLSAGMCGYLAKPLHLEHLVEALDLCVHNLARSSPGNSQPDAAIDPEFVGQP